jgi:hypothetical protein
MDRGRYAAQLTWWLQHFPRQQLLLLQYERCVADTQGQLSGTFEFLGLPDQRATVAEISRTRKKSSEHVSLAPELRQLLVEYYAADVAELRTLMPDLDLALWTGFAPQELPPT